MSQNTSQKNSSSAIVFHSGNINTVLDTSGTATSATVSPIITNTSDAISVEMRPLVPLAGDIIIAVTVVDATPDAIGGNPGGGQNNINRAQVRLTLTTTNYATTRSRGAVLFFPPNMTGNNITCAAPTFANAINLTDPNSVTVAIFPSVITSALGYVIMPTKYRLVFQNVGVNDFTLTNYLIRSII